MKNIQYIIIAFFVIGVFSCEDKFINDIDVDVPDEELRLVINLELNAGDTIAKTFVGRTSNITEAESTFFDDAIVELYKEDNLLAMLDYQQETNEYIARFDTLDLSEGEYRVEVSGVDGLEDISSTQNIPPKVNITKGSYQKDGTIEQYYANAYTADEAVISIDDPADQENYYQVRLFGFIQDSLGNITNSTDFYISSLNPIAESGFYVDGILLKDDSFNGSQLDLSLAFSNYLDFDYGIDNGQERFLLAELNNITRDNYLYLKSLDAFQNSVDNPFAEPVIVHNNIENGIGIFRARNATYFGIEF